MYAASGRGHWNSELLDMQALALFLFHHGVMEYQVVVPPETLEEH